MCMLFGTTWNSPYTDSIFKSFYWTHSFKNSKYVSTQNDKPLKIDQITLYKTRVKFAQVCILLYTSKPLTQRVWVRVGKF